MSFTSPNSAMPLGGRRAKDMKGSDWRGMLRGLLAAILHGDDSETAQDDAGAKIGASTVFLSAANRALLIKRSPDEKNFAGHWSLPGGNGELGETPEQVAEREATEEIGSHPSGKSEILDKRTTPNGMLFHTFVNRVPTEFKPTLNAEHTDHQWASLDELPEPIHPAVKENLGKLRERIASEEKANDSDLAFDRQTVRSYDADGRLHVDRTPISKATVNEYFGREIPNAENLGLKPDVKYKILRDPEELKKAADTFNNVPLLRRHVSVSADDHKPFDVIGSTGTDAQFNHPYLTNSLVVWSKDDIQQIENELKKELSSSYRYRADMTPGIFEGQEYQGVMRDIIGNHVAVVTQGRAGHDVVVGDSQPSEQPIMNTALSRRVAAIKAFIAPRLAKDQSIDGLEHILALDADPDMMDPGADKKAKDEEEKSKAKKEADDKNAKDAAEEEEKKKVADKKAKDAAEEEEKKKAADRKARDEKKSMDRKARDAAPEGLKGWLKGKMNAEDYGKVCDMLESERKADDEASAMSSMTEKDPDPENTNSTGGAKDKKAMDEDTVKGLVAAERRNQQAIYEARNAVRPRVGELTLAFDSAEDVYKTALEASGVKTAGVHPSAFKAMFGMLPSRNVETLSDRRLAMDAASSKSFAERFPGAAAIRR